jgi:hypothetical protein
MASIDEGMQIDENAGKSWKTASPMFKSLETDSNVTIERLVQPEKQSPQSV